MQRLLPILLCVFCAGFHMSGSLARGAAVILNEYNAVSGSNQLDEGSGADFFFGTIDGNGGNWFELLVIEDQVDMRGWKLIWEEDEEVGNTGQNAEGVITLADAPIWSNVRAGTMITFIETADADGEGNFDTSTDLSFNPAEDDWWINVCSRQEQAKGAAGVLSTTTNDGLPGDFSVGRDDWVLTIQDAASQTIFGPVGEGNPAWDGDGVSNTEGFSLEGPPGTPTLSDWRAVTPTHPDYDDTGSTSFGAPNVDYNSANGTFLSIQDVSALRENTEPTVPGDFDGDGLLTAADIDELSEAVRLGSVDLKYDLDANQIVDDQDRRVWVKQLRRTYFGDADLNGEFNTNDFVAVLQSGQYEDGVAGNSTWATGDWSGDAEFNTTDLVQALQDGGYELGPMQAVAAVPEPQGFLLFLGTVLGLVLWHRAR